MSFCNTKQNMFSIKKEEAHFYDKKQIACWKFKKYHNSTSGVMKWRTAHTNTILFEKRKFGHNFHPLSFLVCRCHRLSLVATRCTTCCHSLSLVVPLVVTRFHSLSHVVPLVVTRCHSMHHSSVFINDRIYRCFPPSDYLKTIWRVFSDDCCNRQWRLNVITCFVDCVIISINCKILKENFNLVIYFFL